jgi:hypothetical protein
MKDFIIIGIIIITLGCVYFGTAHAQLYENQQDLTKIVGGADKNCTNVDIIGTEATTPFLLEVVFDPTTASSITETHNGIAKPIYQKSNQVLVFYTNDTADYYVTVTLDYPQLAKRDVFVRYTAPPNNIISEDLQYYDSKFCRVFHIVTQAPIHIQTREEILGADILNVPKTLSDLVQTQQYNTQVETGTFSSIEFFILMQIILGVITVILFFSNMGQSRKLKIQSTETLKTIRKMGQDNIEIVNGINTKVDNALEKMDKKLKVLGGFLEQFKISYQISEAQKQAVEKAQTELHKVDEISIKPTLTQKVINFYDTYVKLDIFSLRNMKENLFGKTDEESVEKLKVIDAELAKREQGEKNNITEVSKAIENLEMGEKLEEFDPEKIHEYTKEQLLKWYNEFNIPTDIKNREKLLMIHSEIRLRDEIEHETGENLE